VITPGGHTYEHNMLLLHLEQNPTDPATRAPLTAAQLVPNRMLLSAVKELRSTRRELRMITARAREVLSEADAKAARAKREIGAMQTATATLKTRLAQAREEATRALAGAAEARRDQRLRALRHKLMGLDLGELFDVELVGAGSGTGAAVLRCHARGEEVVVKVLYDRSCATDTTTAVLDTTARRNRAYAVLSAIPEHRNIVSLLAVLPAARLTAQMVALLPEAVREHVAPENLRTGQRTCVRRCGGRERERCVPACTTASARACERSCVCMCVACLAVGLPTKNVVISP
jgi:hypothetical protein